MEEEKIKAAIELMKKRVEEYNEEMENAHYKDSFICSGGKAIGVEEALDF